MDNKKFVNLNANYKAFLGKVDDIFKKYDIGLETPYNKLQNVHEDIEKLFVSGVFERNDVNHLLKNCENKNETLRKLKDYVYLKNVRTLEKTIKDDKYTDFSNNIKKLKGGGISSKDIDKAFIKVVKPYFEYWDGVWKFIEFNGNKIKKVDIIDPIDLQLFYDHLE